MSRLTLCTLEADTTPPTVIPPAAVSVFQSECSGGVPGASVSTLLTKVPAQATALSAFLEGASGTDACLPPPRRLHVRSGGTELDGATFFAMGVTPATFSYMDAAGNVGTATSTVTVEARGDLNLDGVIDVFDVVILQSYIVGNVAPGVAPFLGSTVMADYDGSGTIDVFDVVLLMSRIVGNSPCA